MSFPGAVPNAFVAGSWSPYLRREREMFECRARAIGVTSTGRACENRLASLDAAWRWRNRERPTPAGGTARASGSRSYGESAWKQEGRRGGSAALAEARGAHGFGRVLELHRHVDAVREVIAQAVVDRVHGARDRNVLACVQRTRGGREMVV